MVESGSWGVLYDKVIVRRDPEKTHTVMGMEIPDQAREKQNRGSVIAVGDGRIVSGSLVLIPLTLRVGDEVLFNKFAGTPLDEDKDPDVVVLREDEILAYRRIVS